MSRNSEFFKSDKLTFEFIIYLINFKTLSDSTELNRPLAFSEFLCQLISSGQHLCLFKLVRALNGAGFVNPHTRHLNIKLTSSDNFSNLVLTCHN